MNAITNKKLLIFDLDGTLVNTAEDIADSVNAAMAHFHYPVHSNEKIVTFIGNGARTLIKRAMPSDETSEEKVDEVLEYYRNWYDHHLIVHTYVYDGLLDALNELKNRGVKLAVLSNKDNRHVREIVNTLLPDIFDVANGYLPEYPHKPAPDSTLAIAERLGIKPEACAFIGDSAVDIQTAKRAGMTSVGVAWGFSGTAPYAENVPDMIAYNSKDLIK